MKKIKNINEAIRLFKAKVYSQAPFRKGISSARKVIDEMYISGVIKTLGKQQLFLNGFAVTQFPSSFNVLTRHKRLNDTSLSYEFIWTASVLSLFETQLSRFVLLRKSFETQFLFGNLDAAEVTLNLIQNEFGISIWLISNKIQLLQAAYGLKSHKDYLEGILNEEGVSEWVAFISYYLSLNAEETSTLASAGADLEGINASPYLADFLLALILPTEFCKVSNIESVLLYSENHTLIDRYQIFINACRLQIAKEEKVQSFVEEGLDAIKNIPEPFIQGYFDLVVENISVETSRFVKLCDEYSDGNYEKILEHKNVPFELVARANLNLGTRTTFSVEDTFYKQIISCVETILEASDDYSKAINRLEKIALILNGHQISFSLIAFLKTNTELPIHESTSLSSSLEMLSLGYINPRYINEYSRIFDKKNLLQALSHAHHKSSSLLLVQAINSELELGIDLIENSKIEGRRKLVYIGSIALKHQRFEKAVEAFDAITDENNLFIYTRKNLLLFQALFSTADIYKCVILVVKHYLKHQGSHNLYPINKLVERAKDEGDLFSNIYYCILLSIVTRHVNSNYERDISDIYENVLYHFNVDKPSQLIQFHDEIGQAELVYFLRYISVIRVLDDTTTFESQNEIESERIYICQLLKEIDPQNSGIYSSEIRTITKDSKVSQLLMQVQTSKVYVDEEGLRTISEDSLGDTFLRYLNLIKYPELDYQAEKITKRLEFFMGDKAPPEIKNIKLPPTEASSLFSSLVSDFVILFLLNPAYGLDTHISTSIRHGAFEGDVRNPFAKEDLLCHFNKETNSFDLQEKWIRAFTQSRLSDEEIESIKTCLVIFTKNIESLIHVTLNSILQARTNDNDSGYLNFYAEEDKRIELRRTMNEQSTFQDFFEVVNGFCWQLADASLTQIKDYLTGEFSLTMHKIIDDLANSVDEQVDHERIISLHNAIITSRTNINLAIEAITGWFNRPTDLRREPFDFDIIVDVAQKQISNCYVNFNLDLNKSIQYLDKLPGDWFDGLLDILFILFQNIIRNSGFESTKCIGAKLSIEDEGDFIRIYIENPLSQTADIEIYRQFAENAQGKYKSDTALKMARKEGGSGLSKVWRILEHDLKTEHGLFVCVNDDYRFGLTLRFKKHHLDNVNENMSDRG